MSCPKSIFGIVIPIKMVRAAAVVVGIRMVFSIQTWTSKGDGDLVFCK
jgi:hypothetical protein